MAEELNYKGYRLLISPVGKGWRAMIYAPHSQFALAESPATLEKRLLRRQERLSMRSSVRKINGFSCGRPPYCG
jgi:hypothetical protein